MKKNDVYGYIRVSDTKQIDGASLSEQERAITEYAKKNNLTIIKWFEETKTAAKRGRPKFTEMLKLLKSGEAGGVIMHKIDRSARNLHDWASVGDLIDNGIQVHFAHESLDMTERGGRLSADIQAVMASDYVRNLRQEIIKGINGRLNQGIFPFAAPIGYLNNGKGKLKTKDLTKYHLIQEMFSLYSSGNYNALTISKIMFQKGLRNHNGNKVGKTSILRLLKNPFYIGLLEVKGKIYSGIHEPIVEKRIFSRVQDVIKGRIQHKGLKHDYLFRKRIKCKNCSYFLLSERQKGNVYYRCATKECPTKTIREDFIQRAIHQKLRTITFKNKELKSLDSITKELKFFKDDTNNKEKYLTLELNKLKKKESKLLEAYLDSIINGDEYQSQKNNLTSQIHVLELRIQKKDNPKQSLEQKISNFLELIKTLKKPYDKADKNEKRKFLEIVTSNFTVYGKSLYFSIQSPFKELIDSSFFSKCALSRNTSRTLHPKIIYTDNNELCIVNDKVTLIERPTLSKKQLREWCEMLDRKFDYVPSLDELLYPNYQPSNEND